MGVRVGCFAAVCLVAVMAWGRPASADTQTIHQLLANLTPYDLEGSRSFEALVEITRAAAAADSLADRTELSFLHAMASADLWLIASNTGNEGLRDKLEAHFGVDAETLPAVIADALVALRGAMPASAVDDALEAMRALSRAGAEDGALPEVKGTRSSLAYLGLFASRVPLEEAPSVSQLASFGVDPCAKIEACPDPYVRFDAEGRAALSALSNATEALHRLAGVSDRDPLVAAVLAPVEARFAVLRGLSLRPGLRLTEGAACALPTACGAKDHSDILVLVEPERVRFGFAPSVRVGEDGKLGIEAPGEPVWPATRSVSISSELRPFLTQLDGVTKVLQEMHAKGEGLSVAVGAAPETRAHVWARVMLSTRAAGFDEPLVLGRTSDGSARSQVVRVVPALAADKLAPGEINTMLLLKGYSVRRLGPSVTIDRRTNAEGRFEFDVKALVRKAKPRNARSSYLRFVPYVAAGDLVDTAFAVAPKHQRVTVILP